MTPHEDTDLRVLADEARRALSKICPELVWQDVEADHLVPDAARRRQVRIEKSTAQGPRLRAGDEKKIVEALNWVLQRHGFPPQEPSGGSPWGELVLTSTRAGDHASFEWRGAERVRLWIDLPR